LYFDFEVAFSRTTHILYLMGTPRVSKIVNVCDIVMNFEEMVPPPNQLSACHRISAEYFTTRLIKYGRSLSNDVHVRVNSTTRSRAIDICRQNGVELAIQ
jgi:hypothetical protein